MSARSATLRVDYLLSSGHDVQVVVPIGVLIADERWLTSAWVLGDLDALRRQLS